MNKEIVNYGLQLFKKIQRGQNRFCYNRRYYLFDKINKKELCGSGYIELKWVLEHISNFYVLDENDRFPDLKISFSKPFDLDQGGRKGVYFTKNLNFLEKIIFRYSLRNLDKFKIQPYIQFLF